MSSLGRGQGSGVGGADAGAERIRIAQPLGHGQLWEGLSSDKKFQRGANQLSLQ